MKRCINQILNIQFFYQWLNRRVNDRQTTVFPVIIFNNLKINFGTILICKVEYFLETRQGPIRIFTCQAVLPTPANDAKI